MATHYTIRGGIDSSAVYKEEANYAVNPGTWTANAEHFGLTQSVTPSISRSLVKLRGLTGILPAVNTVATSRDAQDIKAGKSELSVNVTYQPQHFKFLKYVIGSTNTIEADGIYYPQKTAATYADKKKYVSLPSFSICQRFNFGGSGDAADSVLILTGLKVNTWEMSASIGDPVSCTSSLMGSDITINQTTVDTSYPFVALSAEDVYHFIDSDVKIGSVSIANLIDSFTLNINNNCQGLGDLRSYINEAVVAMGRDWTITIDQNFENITQIKNLLGGVAGVGKPVKIDTINIELSKSVGKTLTCTLKNLRQAEGMPGINYGDISKESITLEAEYGFFVENKE